MALQDGTLTVCVKLPESKVLTVYYSQSTIIPLRCQSCIMN